MKHDKLPAEIAQRIPQAAFDALQDNEAAQQSLIDMAQQALEAIEEAQKRAQKYEEEEKTRKEDELRRRRGLVVPLESIGTSRSLFKIQGTEEWRRAQMALEDSLDSGLITQQDYEIQLEETEKDLLRIQKAKYRKELRHRTVQSVDSMQEKIRKLTTHGYMKTIVDPELLYEDERVELEEGVLIIPSREAMEDQVSRMLDITRARAQMPNRRRHQLRDNHNVIVETNLFFVANNRHPSYTNNMMMTLPNGNFHENWFEIFKQAAIEKYKTFAHSEHYEELEEACLSPKATIHVILTQFDSVEEWFDDVAADEKTRDMHDFRLLLCADKGKPCIQQAVEHFGRIWNKDVSLRQNLEEPCSLTHDPFRTNKDGSPRKHSHTKACSITRKVVLYSPLVKDIRQIRSINDLTRKDDVELVDSTDCKSVARLLAHKGHVGVIKNIFRSKLPSSKSHRGTIERTPVRAFEGEQEAAQIFLDFETFRQRTLVEDSADEAVPFLVAWSSLISETVETLHSEQVVSDFVDRILEDYIGSTVVLWAWNGSGFDHHLLLGELKNRMPDEEDIKQRSNRILQATFKFGGTTVILKDPMLFIPSSLARAAKDFGVLSKGDFPHVIVSDRSCLTQVISEWYVLKSKTVESVISDCGKIMLVTAESYKKIVETGNKLTVLEKAIEYCKIDVQVMKQIWLKFKQDMRKSLGLEIPIGMMTLPQLAYSVLVSKLPKGAVLHIPEGDEYDFIRKAQFGGRVMAKKGVYNERCIYVDVVSEYPSVMWLYDQPYGPSFETKEINRSKLGIYDVSLVFKPCEDHPYSSECPLCRKKKADYTEFLPRRDPEDGRLKHSWLHEQRGVWCTYDLEIALDDGYVVTEVHSGLEWKYKGKIFSDFIDTVKGIKENAPTPSQRQIGKILMNSSYGKLNQKPINEEMFIVPRGTAFQFLENIKTVDGNVKIAGSTIKMPVFQELDDHWEKMSIKVPGENRHPTQNGVFVLAGARKFLRDHLLKIRKHAPNVKVIYSDTDSMIIIESSLDVAVGDMIWNEETGSYAPSKIAFSYDPTPHFGKELGKLDDTVVKGFSGVRLDRVVVAGKKMYGYEFEHPESGKTVGEIHMKGVPNRMLSMAQLDHLLEGNDRRIRYAMMLMKKSLVSVQMVDIVKEVGCITGTGSRKATQRCIDNECGCVH